MLKLGKDELICDLAEEYHIFNIRSLPARLVATLAAGLRNNSRIKKKISGSKHSDTEILLMQIHDAITTFAWSLGVYGEAGKAPSIFDVIEKPSANEEDGNYKTYNSGADFIAAWNK